MLSLIFRQRGSNFVEIEIVRRVSDYTNRKIRKMKLGNLKKKKEKTDILDWNL